MGKEIMAVEAAAAMGSEAEVKASQNPTAQIDKALHKRVAQIDSLPTAVDEEDRAPREATVRDEAKAKVKDGHHLHKVAKVPMLIDKEIRSTDHRTESSREVNKIQTGTKAVVGTKGKAKAKARGRIIKATEDKANRIRARKARVNKTKVRIKVRTTTTKARTTTTRARTTTTTTKVRIRMGIEVKASRTRTRTRTRVSKTRAAIGDKDSRKTRGSFRTTTTIITIIIMATTTSPSQKSLSRQPRSRPRLPSRPQPPPPRPNQQNNLLLLHHRRRKRRLSPPNHRRPWHHHLLLQNKLRPLRL